MKITDIIFNNFWAKFIALILAVATWFYVFDLINSDSSMQAKDTMEDLFSRYEFVVKKVPVKPVFIGSSPHGYKAVFEKVKVDPAEIAIFGPREAIEGVSELNTGPINLNEYTRSAKVSLGLRSNTKYLQMRDKVVDVYFPIEPVIEDVGGEKPVEQQ